SLLLAGLGTAVSQDPPPDGPAAGAWYRADRLGNTEERVSPETAASLEHALQRAQEGDLRVERLYSRGVLLEERRTGPGVDELSAYLPDGSLEYTERLLRYPDGTPREVRRQTGEQLRIYRYRKTTGLPFEEWFQHGEERRVWRFGPGGRLAERVAWNGETMTFRERFSYSEAGALVEARRENLETGEERIRRYDGGLVIREELRRDGRPAVTTRYTYGAQDRLILEERETPDGSLLLDYEYDEEGQLSHVRHLRNGAITLVVRYTEEGRVEDRYRNGSLVLRSHFIGDTRAREELYRDGRLIDVRGGE
ncbi:MAG: hypothetical protein ACOCW6_11650, partial [Spirochaetota bacterium]